MHATCAGWACDSRVGPRFGSGASGATWLEHAASITAIKRMTRPTPIATVTLKRRERPREGGLAIGVIEVRPIRRQRAPLEHAARPGIWPPPGDRELAVTARRMPHRRERDKHEHTEQNAGQG